MSALSTGQRHRVALCCLRLGQARSKDRLCVDTHGAAELHYLYTETR